MGRMLVASSVSARLRGLLFREPSNRMVLLVPCRDIHTFGMEYAIDVAFLDREGRVLESYRDVLPKHRCRCRKAHAAVERFAQPRKPWLRQGDYLDVSVEYERDE